MDMIVESAQRLFGRNDPLAAGSDCRSSGLWTEVEEAGYPLALLGEDEGGFGLTALDALAPVAIAAAHAVPLPVGETMLANWLLVKSGLEPAPGRLAAVTSPQGLGAVPFGRHLDGVVVVSDSANGPCLALHRSQAAAWRHDENIAGEPRDSITAADLGPPVSMAHSPVDAATLRALVATLRAHQMAGATGRVLDMTLRYAGERVQFGRNLSAFQAIQHQFAQMAGHVAAAATAADIAVGALPLAIDAPADFAILAGAAKLRAGEAATAVAAAAHQIHGAIGFSHEYPLHPLTRRLWAWRDESGSEAEWAGVLANAVADLPEGGLWPFLTSLHETAA